MKRILFFLLFTIIALSCEKQYYTSIPDFPVNIELRLENQDYNLNTNLAYVVVTQQRFPRDRLGFGGILVINGMGENIINLYAYDLACPEEVQRNVRVVPNNLSSSNTATPTAITATCPKCGAVFNIATGTGAPQSGSKYFLKSYRVIGNGMQYTVTN
jgi:hypothetical protein